MAEFVEAVKKRTGHAPTARTWFGYVSVWTCALAAAKAKSLKALDMAKALQGFELPPEIALGPNPAVYRAGQNQLMATLFVGVGLAERRWTGGSVQGDERHSGAPMLQAQSRRAAARWLGRHEAAAVGWAIRFAIRHCDQAFGARGDDQRRDKCADA